MSDSALQLNILNSRKALYKAIARARRCGVTIVIEGPPGSGKTEITEQLASLGKDCLPEAMEAEKDSIPDTWRPKVVSTYASQVTGEDLVGMPFLPPGETSPEHFEFVTGKALRSLKRGDFWIGDEITTPAAPSTEKAMLQMAASKIISVGDWVGPPDVTRILLGNRPEDGNVDYSFNPVVGNRVVKYEYTGPTVDEWIPWFFAHDGHPVIGTVIKMEQELLNKYDAELDRSPSPRSWFNASRNLTAAEWLAGGRHNVSIAERMQCVAAAVGDAAALQVEAIFQLHDKLIPFGAIVKDPDNCLVPDPHHDPAAHFLTVTHVGNRCTPDVWKPVSRYIARLPVEMQAVAVTPIKTKFPELITTPEFQEFTVRTSGLVIDE